MITLQKVFYIYLGKCLFRAFPFYFGGLFLLVWSKKGNMDIQKGGFIKYVKTNLKLAYLQ